MYIHIFLYLGALHNLLAHSQQVVNILNQSRLKSWPRQAGRQDSRCFRAEEKNEKTTIRIYGKVNRTFLINY